MVDSRATTGAAGGQGVGHLGVHEWGERHAGILPGGRAPAEGPSTRRSRPHELVTASRCGVCGNRSTSVVWRWR